MLTPLLALMARLGVPEPLRKAAAWLVAIVGAIALLWALKAIYDASVIDRHEAKQEQRAAKALDDAAEQRANDAIVNMINEKDREDAINAAPTGTGLSDPERALGCERLRKLGRHLAACEGY